MHSENKECDDSVMSTSSNLQQINEKGEYLVRLQYFKLGIFCLFLCMFACFLQYVVFCTQNKAGNGYLKPAPPWREGRTRTGTNAHTPERRVEMFGIKSLENHLTKMTFLESK